jgi:uncharacterized protein (DUF488 family)
MMQQSQPKECFTIGYGNYPIDRFITFLQNISCDLIIDVRSSPYSRFNPHFNRENLHINGFSVEDSQNFFHEALCVFSIV